MVKLTVLRQKWSTEFCECQDLGFPIPDADWQVCTDPRDHIQPLWVWGMGHLWSRNVQEGSEGRTVGWDKQRVVRVRRHRQS